MALAGGGSPCLTICAPSNADLRDIGLATGAGQQALEANAVEAVPEDVDQDAADKVLSEVWDLH